MSDRDAAAPGRQTEGETRDNTTGFPPKDTAAGALSAALDAAGRGWHVFPVAGKVPVGKWTRQASDDPEQIVAALAGTSYGYGIACGPSHLLVVDEDRPGGFAAFAASIGQAIPATFTVATGKGAHFYFRADPGSDLGNAPGPLAAFGCDIRGRGGYVVGAGSPHPNGGRYRVAADLPAAGLPDWLAEALTPPVRPGDTFAAPSPSGLGILPEVIPGPRATAGGQRHEVLMRYASSLRARNLDPAEAWPLLLAAWQRCEQPPTCETPFTQEDLRALAGDVWQRYPAGGTAKAPQVAAGATEPGRWAPVDLTEILDGTAEPERPRLLPRTDGQHLLYPGRVHSFHGESESGKSMIAQAEVARLVGAGFDAAIIDYESDPASVVARLVALGAAREAIAARLTYLRPDGPPEVDPAGFAALLTRRFALVVIDGVGEALATGGRSSKDNDEVTGWLRTVPKAIADGTGAAVLLVDHVTKAEDGRGRFAIGAQAKLAGLTGAAYTVEVAAPLGRGMVGVVNLRVAKDRPGGVRPHCGAYRKTDRTQLAAVVTVNGTNPERLAVTVAPPDEETQQRPSGAFRPTTLMQRVSEALDAAPEPLTFNGITERVRGKREFLRTAVDVLLAEGYVTAEPGGRGGGHRHRSVRTYREADEPREPVPAEVRPEELVTGSGPLDRGTGNQFLTGSGNQLGTSWEPVPNDLETAPIDPANTCQQCGRQSSLSLIGGRCRRCRFATVDPAEVAS